MATTPTYINQRINNLQAQINAIITGGVPTTSNLADVLANGNSAGAFGIGMNGNALTNAVDITVVSDSDASQTTLNGYSVETLEQNDPNIVNLMQLSPNALYVDSTDNSVQQQTSTRVSPGDFEVYGHTSSGNNNSSVRIVNDASINAYFEYSKQGTRAAFFPFRYNNIETFRYDNTGIILASGKVVTGNLTGTASTASTVTTTSDNTSGTYYIPFTKTTAGINKPLFIDDVTGPLSYNPSTASLSATTFVGALTGTASTATNITGGLGGQVLYQSGANVTAKLANGTAGQILQANGTTVAPSWVSVPVSTGLVFLQTVSGNITGSGAVTNFNLTSIFNTTYKNYKIDITFSSTSTSHYPSYSLTAFLGTGTVPTTASLYGYEMTSLSTTVVSPVFTSGATIASSPLTLAVSCVPNRQVTIIVENVGSSTAVNANSATLTCKSVYSNPGINGSSDRTISTNFIASTTITGLTLQQTISGVGNDTAWSAKIYGYK